MRRGQMGLMLLASQVLNLGVDNIPPVTLGVLALNVYLFLFPAVPLAQACVSVHRAYWMGDWRRVLLSPLHHADDLHLYFNMASFLWKGARLERRLGRAWFLYLLTVFSLLTGLVYLLLGAGLAELTQDGSFATQCAVGFSGVLFALKVLNNHWYPGGARYVLGVPVANRYACWVELVLIHLTVPGASLIGHLAGILVGLLYTAGPLEAAMRTCAAGVTAGSSRAAPDYPEDYHYQRYAAGMTEEQQYAAAMRNSLGNTRGGGSSQRAAAPPPPADGFSLPEEQDAEEVRRWRLRRFEHY